MSTIEYAAKIKRSKSTVQAWCMRGLIGKLVGGKYEIPDDAEPPQIPRKRKTGRIKRANRQTVFKRKAVAE